MKQQNFLALIICVGILLVAVSDKAEGQTPYNGWCVWKICSRPLKNRASKPAPRPIKFKFFKKMDTKEREREMLKALKSLVSTLKKYK